MNEPVLTRQSLLFFLAAAVIILCILFFIEACDKRTKVVFCDVGQGNGAYVRLPDGTDIAIDTGPDNRFLACIGRYMPFFDRTIEYVVISHPQADHEGGLDYLLNRYTVGQVLFAKAFETDPNMRNHRKIQRTSVFSFIQNGTYLTLNGNTRLSFYTTSVRNGSANEKSLVVCLSTRFREYLFTGDIASGGLSSLTHTQSWRKLVLEVPHHGSATGLSEYFLKKTRPQTAVISVGNNSYGHPARQTLEMLGKYNIPIKRTDKNGDIVFTE